MRVLALLLLPLAALAQGFSGLATNFDGSVLYFASSARQTSTQQTFHSKIYRWDAASGIKVAAEEVDEGEPFDCTTSKFFNLIAPQVSPDGALLGYTATRPNPVSRYCSAQEPNQGTVLQAGKSSLAIPGLLEMSASGRYVVSSPLNADVSGYHVVVDLAGGLTTLAVGKFSGATQQVTDAGAVLTVQGYAAMLTSPSGQSRLLLTQHPIATAVVDRAGKTVFYASAAGPSASAYLAAIDVASEQELPIESGLAFQTLSVSANGGILVYSGYNDLRTATLVSGIARTVRPGNYISAVVSGDGRFAFGIASTGGIERIDVLSGASVTIASAPPRAAAYLVSGNPVTDVAAGSVLTFLPSALTLSSICGNVPARRLNKVLSNFEIPFGQPEGNCDVITASGGFESVIHLQIHRLLPQFVYNGLLTHADFQPVSTASPAFAGEALVAFMTGLGPVDANGLLQNQLGCLFDNQSTNILYAGLSPAYPGIYQVNLRLPSSLTRSASLICRFPSDPAYYAQADVAIGPAPN